MRKRQDKIAESILKILNKVGEPLETREIEELLKGVTRVKILYRLNQLRGEGLIKAKSVGSGKGAWIWWASKLFKKGEKLE